MVNAIFTFGKIFVVRLGEHSVVMLLLLGFGLFKCVRAIDLPFVEPTCFYCVFGACLRATHAHKAVAAKFQLAAVRYGNVVGGTNIYALSTMYAVFTHLVPFTV